MIRPFPRRLIPFLIKGGIAIFVLWYAQTAGKLIVDGRLNMATGLGFAGILLALPFIIRNIGLFPLFGFVVFLFWVPKQIPLHYIGSLGLFLSPVEFLIFGLALLIVASNGLKRTANWRRTWQYLPLLPFSIYILGGLIGVASSVILLHVDSPHTLSMFRLWCIYPLLLCFVCIYLVDSRKRVEKVLWLQLGSMSLLGLLFLFGRLTIDVVTLSDYGFGSGRLSMFLKVPYFGSIEILPESASSLFSMCYVMAFMFALSASSRMKRLGAVSVVILSAAVMLKAMGRSGIIASTLSSGLMWYLWHYQGGEVKRVGAIVKIATFFGCVVGIVWFMGIRSEFEGYRNHVFEMLSNPREATNMRGRFEVWLDTIPIILKHPWGIGPSGLLGIGNVSRELANDIGSVTAAHNLILYLLLSGGFVGASGFLLIIITFLKRCQKCLKTSDNSLRMFSIMGIGLCAALLVGGVSTPYFHDYMKVTAFWLPVSCIMAAMSLPNERTV